MPRSWFQNLCIPSFTRGLNCLVWNLLNDENSWNQQRRTLFLWLRMFCHLGNSSSFVEQIFIWVYFNLITLSFFELLLSLTRKGFFSFMRRKWKKKKKIVYSWLYNLIHDSREKSVHVWYITWKKIIYTGTIKYWY